MLACVFAFDTPRAAPLLRAFLHRESHCTPESATGDSAVEGVVSGWLEARLGP
jgi:hypothetical protein